MKIYHMAVLHASMLALLPDAQASDFLHHLRQRGSDRSLSDCPGQSSPDSWCKREGGYGAYAKDGQSCYNDWHIDCYCRSDYTKNDDMGCCHYSGSTFCKILGGDGARAKSSAKCFNNWGDCECASGYTEKNDRCERVARTDCHHDKYEFCKNLGGEGARPKSSSSCFDTWSDCYCTSGYEEENGKCVKKDDCQGHEFDCSHNPWEFCKKKLGDGGIPKPNRSCYDTSDDCTYEHWRAGKKVGGFNV